MKLEIDTNDFVKHLMFWSNKTDDEFAKKWGDLGSIYGHGWRNWGGKSDNELYDDYLKKVKVNIK